MDEERNMRMCLALDHEASVKIDRLAIDAGISRSAAMRELIAQQEGALVIPDHRLVNYTPWNDRVGRSKK